MKNGHYLDLVRTSTTVFPEMRAFAEHTGLHMGQWLCVPMIVGGAYLVATSAKRRVRVESIAGTASVA